MQQRTSKVLFAALGKALGASEARVESHLTRSERDNVIRLDKGRVFLDRSTRCASVASNILAREPSYHLLQTAARSSVTITSDG